MRTFFTLLGREIKSYFYSPIAYVVLFFFILTTSANFFLAVKELTQNSTEVTLVEANFLTVLFWFPLILIFPLLTMRTYADEFRTGTIESLTTAPVGDLQVVLAKYFGALFFYCVLWLPTAAYFGLFQWVTGRPAAASPGAYWGAFGLLLMIGIFYTAIGCLASALSTEQINAAVITFVIIFAAFVIGLTRFFFSLDDTYQREMVWYVSAYEHMIDFSRGLLDSRPVFWYTSMTALVLTINFQVFQFRKWKA